jgi:hypothetical protein
MAPIRCGETVKGKTWLISRCIHSWRITKSFKFWNISVSMNFQGPQQKEHTSPCSNSWSTWRKAHRFLAWQLYLMSLSTWFLWPDAAVVCRTMYTWTGWGWISQQ